MFFLFGLSQQGPQRIQVTEFLEYWNCCLLLHLVFVRMRSLHPLARGPCGMNTWAAKVCQLSTFSTPRQINMVDPIHRKLWSEGVDVEIFC